MCNFLSGVVTRDGRLHMMPESTDSHTDIIEFLGLHEGHAKQDISDLNLVRVEYSPSGGEHFDLDSFVFKLDENVRPAWFDAELEARTIKSMRDRIERMIVDDKRKCLIGGCWILIDGADVDRISNARIITMWGSSSVGEMCGSSKVGTMWDSSSVGTMRGSSNVGTMRDSSKVRTDLRVKA